MANEIVFRRSDQLSPRDKEHICDLFFAVFKKTMSLEEYDRKYLCTPLGYSYHGLMVADGRFVGAYNIIPYRYMFFGRQVLLGLSVDAMLAREARTSPLGFRKMAACVYEAMQEDGIGFAFGSPNDNAYEYTRRVLCWQDIGSLDCWVLPRNVGSVLPRLRSLNLLSRSLSAGLVHLPGSQSRNSSRKDIRKVSDDRFKAHRYDRRHTTISVGQHGECVYRIDPDTFGPRVLFLIDVTPLDKCTLDAAVKEVYRRHAPSVDMICYIGTLPFRPTRLLRVPDAWRPRDVRICGKMLTPGYVDDRIFDMQNWELNLANLDLI